MSPPPSSGIGLIVTGSIFVGVGVLNLATAPLCKTSVINRDVQDICLYASLGVGASFTAAGIPMLVVGSSRRRQYKEWRQAHGGLASLLEGISFSASTRAGGLTWRSAF
jgi:hypothetical protein